MIIQTTKIHTPLYQTPREIVPRHFLICLERTLPNSDLFEEYFLAPDVNSAGNPLFDHDPLFQNMSGYWTESIVEAMRYPTAEFALIAAQVLMENYNKEQYFSDAAKTLRKYAVGGEKFWLTVVMEETKIKPLHQISKCL